MVLAGLVIAVGRRRRRRHHRRREHRATAAAAPRGRERPTSTARIILDASLEVRGAIVYATLIDVGRGRCLSSSWTGCPARSSGRSRSPTRWRCWPRWSSRLTVTPALACILLRDGAARAPRVPAGALAAARLPRPLADRSPGRGWTYAAVGAIVADRRPGLAGPRTVVLPEFKERDFLMHWMTKPGTSHPEMVRITTLASKELRAIPGVRNFGAHIGQASRPTRWSASNFGENWISVDPAADYDATLGRDPGGRSTAIPGSTGTYRPISRSGSGRCLPGRATRSSCASTAPIWRSCAPRRTRSRSRRSGRRCRRAARRASGPEPQIEVEVDLARPNSTGSRQATSAARPRRC